MGSESSEPQPTRMSTINNVEDLRNMPPPPAPQMSDIPSQNEQSEFYFSDVSMEQGEELVTKDKKKVESRIKKENVAHKGAMEGKKKLKMSEFQRIR